MKLVKKIIVGYSLLMTLLFGSYIGLQVIYQIAFRFISHDLEKYAWIPALFTWFIAIFALSKLKSPNNSIDDLI